MTTVQESPPRVRPMLPEYIVSTAGTCGGRPRITGTRITVHDVYVWHELQGKSVDEIVSLYPHLTMSGVHAALAYLWEHRADILARAREDDEFAARMKASTPSLLQERVNRLGGSDATDH